jgi:hypothetical protein
MVAIPGEPLLVRVTNPVTEPVTVGSNWTFRTAVAPAFRVAGDLMPEILNPAPDTATVLMVRAAVPLDVMVTDCVAATVKSTFPKLILLALNFSAATPVLRVSTKVVVSPPKPAVNVTERAEETAA